MIGSIADWTAQLPWGTEFVAQGAIVMTLLGAVLAALLKGGRVQHPALRHRAWLGLTIGAVLLPFLLAIGPRWQVQAPGWWEASTPPTLQLPLPVELEQPLASTTSPALRYGGDTAASLSVPLGVVKPHGAASGPEDGGTSTAMSWWTWAVALYWLGSFYFALRLGVGWCLGRRLVAQSAPLKASSLASDLGTEPRAFCQEILGDRSKEVQLRLSDQVASPVCVGGWRPAILLPGAWHHWDATTRRAVLAHELHHVRRGDPQAQLWGLAARCIYWFHPLSWWLVSHLSQLAERSCDARAVDFAKGHHAYARLLLQVAGQVRDSRPSMPLALGMDGHCRLSERVRWLLAGRRVSAETSPLAARFWGGALLVATLFFGAVELSTVTAQGPAAPANAVVFPSVPLPLAEVTPPPVAEPQVPKPEELPSPESPPVADVMPQPEPVPRPTQPPIQPEPVSVPVPGDVIRPLGVPDINAGRVDLIAGLDPIEVPRGKALIRSQAEPTFVSALTVPEASEPPQPVATVASLDVPAAQAAMSLSFPFALPRQGQCSEEASRTEAGHLILLFDDKNRAARSRPRSDLTEPVLHELMDWIEHRVSPCDQVAVLSYQSRLRMHQDFTRDPDALLRAVSAAQRPKAANDPGHDGALGQALAPEALRRKQSIYKVLEHLADASGRLSGRTTVLLITPGFDENNHFYTEVGPLARLGRAQQRLRKPIAAFQDVGTVVHAVNPWPAAEREGLRLLTQETGGWYLFGFQAPVDENVWVR